MKPLSLKLFLLLIPIAAIACRNSSSTLKEVDKKVENRADTASFADLKYIEDFYDFGTIKSGEVVTYTFHFRNVGNAPLIIKDVITSCGCTTTKLSKTVFEPNELGHIEVVFNSKGWFGSQYKSATLRTNSAIREKSVTIKANVV